MSKCHISRGFRRHTVFTTIGTFLIPIVAALLWMKGATAKRTSDSSQYLYHTEEANGVIIDYEPDTPETATPEFLYGPNQGPRVVEFYAPWCPRTHYIRFAEQVKAILHEFNEQSGSTTLLPAVQFYAVSCTANQKVCRGQGVRGYPKIKLYAAGAQQNATAEISYWKLHAFDVLDTLKIQIDQWRFSDSALALRDVTHDGAIAKIDGSKSRLRKTPDNSVSTLHRTKQQVFDDAYLSFDFNLRNAIFLSDDPLTNKTKIVLREWLELVKKTTPVVWRIHAVIHAILTDFDTAVRTEDNWLAILDRYPATTTSWSHSCTKGVSGMGYTCGLWQLFHIMSVGLVEYNLMIGASDDVVLKELSIRTTSAAETLRNFIEYFFACEVCRLNFLHAYDACALDRCSRLSDNEMNSDQWVQFPVWLFETHNAVNARLLRERADRENRISTPAEEVTSQWPSRNACVKCWLDSGGWDEDNVYKYLRTEYWSEDFVTAEYRADVGANIQSEGLSDHPEAPPPTMQLLPWGVVVALVMTWYTKRAQRIKSGLHKKRDSDC